jgi:ferritin-like metal-binding protein YciE
MAESTDAALAEIRAKRQSIDNRLELIRVRMERMDPRRIPAKDVAMGVLPVAALGIGAWAWKRRGRRMRSLDDLLAYGLRELYSAETQIRDALPAMIAKSTDPDLTHAFELHLRETEAQIDRLHRVFRSVRVRPRRQTVAAIAGIVADTERLIRHKPRPDVLDAALVTAAQRVEHYEIAAYGTARTHAETLGYTYAADQLQQTLEEERAMDQRLTRLAERFINLDAMRQRSPAGDKRKG